MRIHRVLHPQRHLTMILVRSSPRGAVASVFSLIIAAHRTRSVISCDSDGPKIFYGLRPLPPAPDHCPLLEDLRFLALPGIDRRLGVSPRGKSLCFVSFVLACARFGSLVEFQAKRPYLLFPFSLWGRRKTKYQTPQQAANAPR